MLDRGMIFFLLRLAAIYGIYQAVPRGIGSGKSVILFLSIIALGVLSYVQGRIDQKEDDSDDY